MVGFEDTSGTKSLYDSNSEEANVNGTNSPTKESPEPPSARAIHPQPWCGQHVAPGQENGNKNVYNYSNQDDKEKTPMCRIAELARFHKLKHEYVLLDESGPAHKKMFTVQLFLSAEQKFDGSGASIKKAQQSAAMVALENTTLELPPERGCKKKKDSGSPPVLLSHVARRLGIAEPTYKNQNPQRMPRTRIQTGFAPPTLGMPARSSSGFHNGYLPSDIQLGPGAGAVIPLIPGYHSPHHQIPIQNGPTLSFYPHPAAAAAAQPLLPIHGHGGNGGHVERTCIVTVTLMGDKVFTGVAGTLSQAKANAASQALVYLGPSIQQLDARLKAEEMRQNTESTTPAKEEVTPSEDATENEKAAAGGGAEGDENDEPQAQGEPPKHRQKSVISQVHECALQMKLNVEFEVLLENGPPHDRKYVVRCSLKNPKNEAIVEADGNGRKKKEATQDACARVLSRLRGIESSPLFIASSLYKSQKRCATQNREQPKRKTMIKDMKMDPSYGHQINPVSRLIQVLQARGEEDPQFELIGEQGQSRYKEFIMQVKCGDRWCDGTGPNKRLAKRAAAEAMLAEIGFVKPLPPPGKSLLKKKNEGIMQIGVFDPNDLGAPPPPMIQPGDALPPSPPHVTQSSEDISSPASESAEPNQEWDTLDTTGSGKTSPDSMGNTNSPGLKRRVTFSNQVKACPPPEDSNYPEPELAPLKTDVVVEGRVKRIRRIKEGKRQLNEEQKIEIRMLTEEFMNVYCHQKGVAMLPAGDDGELAAETPKRRLEMMSEKYKFSVQYTNFPKSPDGSDQLYFALVSLGLEKPIVCHGSGLTVDDAAENAAFNALATKMITYGLPDADDMVMSPPMVMNAGPSTSSSP